VVAAPLNLSRDILHNNLDRNKSQRQSNWTATGTIALRDSNLKVESKPPHEFTAWPSMLPGNLTLRMLDPLFPKSDSVVSCAGSAKCSTRCGSCSSGSRRDQQPLDILARPDQQLYQSQQIDISFKPTQRTATLLVSAQFPQGEI